MANDLTNAVRDRLNKGDPVRSDIGGVSLGTLLQRLENESVAVQEVVIAADATGGQDFVAAFDGKIVDVVVQCNGANVSGSLQVRRATTGITDAIICAVNHVIDRAGTIDDAEDTMVADETLNILANGAADVGTVRILVRRTTV